MYRPKPSNTVVAFSPNPAHFAKTVRETAAKSENVSFGKHARERMEERGISDREAIRVLRTGELRGIGVVTIVLVSGRLFVKTVEWEDL